MKIFDKFKKPKKNDPNEFWNRLSDEVNLDRRPFQEMSEKQLGELISEAQAAYRQGISADRAGEISVAREFYRRAFTLLPTHIEALDNYAISLVDELNFSDAIPIFEKSAVAECTSPLAFVYLVKCYEETGESKKADACAQYLLHHWPDKSPYLDWSHLGNPQEKQLLAPPLEEGQVWKYKARDCDDSSKVWIKLIEPGVDGKSIVHISVSDVLAPDGNLMFISHLPYDANALLDCVTSKSERKQSWNREDDYFGEGYGMWFEAYNVGEAGVFTAPLSEIIEGMLQNIPSKG
jgi:tetratricopeptide (TPR) repeat protein